MTVDRARVAAALPGYELGDELGAGTFGVVLAGWHRSLQRDVAIKMMLGKHGRAAAGFATEARVLAALDHPHVVRVYDYVETGELRLLVMEMLAGGTLTCCHQAGMLQEGACAVGLAIAAALACAHSRGVLHRDIKPDNILFDTTGLLKVVDFGLAKQVGGLPVTASAVAGTPLYMAPEQIDGGRLGPATDLYALGVLLYLLLTGVTPFAPAPSILRQRLEQVPPPPPDVPVRVADAIMWALANDPVARPPSAQAFALYLARAAAEAYGAGWLARSGLVLHLDDDVRAAAERPSVSAPPPLPPIAKSNILSPKSDTAPSPSAGDAPADSLLSQGIASATQVGDRPTGRVRRVRPHHRSAVPPAHRRPGGAPRHRGASRCRIAVIAFLLAGAVALVAATRSGDPSDISIRPLSPPLTGHTHWVLSVLFSPNQRVLASSSRDGTVRLWDVTDRSQPRLLGRPLTGPTDGVTSVAFSPDGHTLAGSSWDRTIWLWDVTDPSAPRLSAGPVSGHRDAVTSVAFSPDGKVLASGSNDGTVRLWDVADRSGPRPLGKPLISHADAVTSVVFSPDGRTLASASYDKTVRLWDLTDRSRPRLFGAPLVGHTMFVFSVAFSPDGHVLASGSYDGTIRLWDVTNRSDPHPAGDHLRVSSTTVRSVAFSPDGRTLASGSFDGTVRLWNVTDLSSPYPRNDSLTVHGDWVMSVVFSADGRTLATGSNDKTVRLWELRQPASAGS
ncbi:MULTISPECIES: WD40 repeat domain-containing serine/threonine protein kinase [Protofrankia]|uniref:Serine/threonine protein kinase with WD40 repeats n=1 Tax=Candidatus Protofrankia datiscae TaxID=2716812 RepID=F8B697_9ACTN|nr:MULTISPECIES: serine/threonine-protein kinase [Protofrankia]AEH08067.1 serine/threonine protein kinase with WD40 repeats [Candidatus Protofrankia datiscae]